MRVSVGQVVPGTRCANQSEASRLEAAIKRLPPPDNRYCLASAGTDD